MKATSVQNLAETKIFKFESVAQPDTRTFRNFSEIGPWDCSPMTLDNVWIKFIDFM